MSFSRRMLIGGAFALGTLGLLRPSRGASPSKEKRFEVEKTDAEWKALLSPAAYDVLRKHGTERAGTSPLLNEHREGTFLCAGCALPLFSSKTKFESHTGWPSFWAPLPDAVGTTEDRKLPDAPHGGALPPLRRASGARVRRWTPADGAPLLHERRRALLPTRLRLNV